MCFHGRVLRTAGAGSALVLAGLPGLGAPAASAAKTEPPVAVEAPAAVEQAPAGDPVAVAWAALARGSQKDAERVLAAAALATPNSAPVLFWKAVCIRSRFDTDAARPAFASLVSQAPNSTEAVAAACMLGIDFSTDWGSALHYYQCLLALEAQHPENDGILWLSALAPRSLSRFDGLPERLKSVLTNHGIDAYRVLLARFAPKKGPVLVHQTLANLLDARGDEEAALVHREIAMRLERSAWSLQGNGLTLINLGRYEEAAQVCRDALSAYPLSITNYHTMGVALWKGGHPTEAFTIWDAVRSHVNEGSLTYYGRCALEAGDWTRAWAYLSAAEKRTPSDKAVKILLARASVHTGLPGASDRLAELGLVFDFQGRPISNKVTADPWFRAIATGDLAAVRTLSATEDINRLSADNKSTALMQAAQNGWVEIMQELIDRHAQLDLSDKNGSTALHYAGQFDQPGSVRLLLAAGAKLNPLDTWQQTPLMCAIFGYCRDGVRQLIAKGADVTVQNDRGDALSFAVANGERTMMQLLLAHGADVNAEEPSTGRTALMVVARDQRHGAFLRPLLEAGADVHRQDRDGRTALHYAIVPQLNMDLVETLLKAGSDPRATSADGITAITEARALGLEELARKMETDTPEPFRWPVLPTIGDDDTSITEAFTLPIRFACEQVYCAGKEGHPFDEKSARQELKAVFGVTNTAGLRTALDRLLHNEGYDEPVKEKPGFDGYFRPQAETAFLAAGQTTPRDHTAWTQAHRIYLAELGVCAHFLPEDDAQDIAQDAGAAIGKNVHDWREFSASFLAGVERFEGWNRGRYQHLCERLLGTRWAAQTWPKAAGTPTAAAAVSPQT